MSSPRFLLLTVEFRKEGRRWLAECRELGTATFGRSLEQARERIGEAVQLHLATLSEVREIERFCQANGVRLYSEYPTGIDVAMPLSDEGVLFQHRVVPLQLAAQGGAR